MPTHILTIIEETDIIAAYETLTFLADQHSKLNERTPFTLHQHEPLSEWFDEDPLPAEPTHPEKNLTEADSELGEAMIADAREKQFDRWSDGFGELVEIINNHPHEEIYNDTDFCRKTIEDLGKLNNSKYVTIYDGRGNPLFNDEDIDGHLAQPSSTDLWVGIIRIS